MLKQPHEIDTPKMTIPDDPGRRGVVGVVVRDGRMLVISRSRSVVAPLVYCFPGGGIEAGRIGSGMPCAGVPRGARRNDPAGAAAMGVRDRLEGRIGVVAGRDGRRRDAGSQSRGGRVNSLDDARGDGPLPDLLASNREFLELLGPSSASGGQTFLSVQ